MTEDLEIEKIGDVAVITLPGEHLDARNADEFKGKILPLMAANPKMVFNMKNIEFIDSSALGLFMVCLRRLRAAGGDLKMVAMSKSVRAIFELVRFHRIIEVYNTKEDAVRSFQA